MRRAGTRLGVRRSRSGATLQRFTEADGLPAPVVGSLAAAIDGLMRVVAGAALDPKKNDVHVIKVAADWFATLNRFSPRVWKLATTSLKREPTIRPTAKAGLSVARSPCAPRRR